MKPFLKYCGKPYIFVFHITFDMAKKRLILREYMKCRIHEKVKTTKPKYTRLAYRFHCVVMFGLE